MRFCLIIFISYLPLFGFSQELDSFIASNIEPLRTFRNVHTQGVIEKVYGVRNAKVLIADYELIRKDFPEIRNLSNEEIDNWLINQTGFISQGQKKQKKVNTKIEINNKINRALRPPEYGRALVYEMKVDKKKVGLIDVKGSGGVNPSFASHNSGTMTLGESLREFSFEKMMTQIVDHSAIENKVVGSYAVIYPGFDVIHQDGSQSPAGFYLRQAHKRFTQAEYAAKGFYRRGNGWLDQNLREKFKKLFNKYGIFAAENYQGTVNDNLFDFGHYIVREDLKASKKAITIPFEQWGFDRIPDEEISTYEDRWKFSKRDRPWIWSHDTAKAFVEGKASRHDVWMNHYNLIKPVQDKLKDQPRLYKESHMLGLKVRICNKHLDSWGR